MMKLTSFLLLVLLLTSCLGDDRKECPQFRLSFGYQADGADNVFSNYIDDVTLFVFEKAGGKFINTFKFSHAQLIAPDGIFLDLPDGDYRLVCWGNAGNNTQFDIGGNYANSRVGHPDYTGAPPVRATADASFMRGTNDRLYFATTDASIQRGISTEASISFTCAYITLEVYIRGLDAAKAPVVEVQHLTPQLDFKMQPVNPYSVTYRPEVIYEAANTRYAASLRALRFATDNPITLEIIEPSGLSLYTLSLAEFMATHDLVSSPATRAIVTEGVQELTIPIEIVFKGTDVAVSIPSWGSETVKPILPEK